MTVAPEFKKRSNDPRRFRLIRGQQADEGLRVTICGVCGQESPRLDGPTGRAWFASHKCGRAA